MCSAKHLFLFFLGLITVVEVSTLIIYSNRLSGTCGKMPHPPTAPWMALLKYESRFGEWVLGCGGVLISSRFVLTSAKCTDFIADEPIIYKLKKVWLGKRDLSRKEDNSDKRLEVPIKKVIVHDKFLKNNDTAHTYDFALLLLDSQVHFNDYISPICLPMSNELRHRKFVKENVFIGGWGMGREGEWKSNDSVLLKSVLGNTKTCNNFYALKTREPFDKDRLCIYGKSNGAVACQGDTGGPLMYHHGGKWYAIGVTSFPNPQCLPPMVLPFSYTRVGKYMSWILKNMHRVHSRELLIEPHLHHRVETVERLW